MSHNAGRSCLCMLSVVLAPFSLIFHLGVSVSVWFLPILLSFLQHVHPAVCFLTRSPREPQDSKMASSSSESSNMPYRYLGSSGARVSAIALGTMNFSLSSSSAHFDVLDAFLAAGGNFIDTADVYSGGESEKAVGEWIKERGLSTGSERSRIFLATKVRACVRLSLCVFAASLAVPYADEDTNFTFACRCTLAVGAPGQMTVDCLVCTFVPQLNNHWSLCKLLSSTCSRSTTGTRAPLFGSG